MFAKTTKSNRGDLQDFAEANQLDYSMFLNNLRKLEWNEMSFRIKNRRNEYGTTEKVELAKSLCPKKAELYIWDEPLNYLDVFNQKNN